MRLRVCNNPGINRNAQESQCTYFCLFQAGIAQLGERQTEDLEVPGSIPGHGIFSLRLELLLSAGSKGLFRESNPGPPAPEAGIIPLDQTAVKHVCM